MQANTETKVCKKCGVEKGVGEYRRFKSRGKEYVNNSCKPCCNKATAMCHKIQYKKDSKFRERTKNKTKERKANYVDDLSDSYMRGLLVRNAIGLSHYDIPPHLVEQKRQQLIAKREAIANKNK